MWSDYAHGSSDVFPEEFDRDGGREDESKAEGERIVQQVATGTDLWPDFIIKDVCSSMSVVNTGSNFGRTIMALYATKYIEELQDI